MDSRLNSRPLLDTNSDSEDVDDYNMEGDIATYYDEIHNESGSRAVESATDDFDDDTQNLFKADNTVPSDRFSFTYIVFYLLGMTTMLPWNFFITAEDVSGVQFFFSFIQAQCVQQVMFVRRYRASNVHKVALITRDRKSSYCIYRTGSI